MKKIIILGLTLFLACGMAAFALGGRDTSSTAQSNSGSPGTRSGGGSGTADSSPAVVNTGESVIVNNLREKKQ